MAIFRPGKNQYILMGGGGARLCCKGRGALHQIVVDIVEWDRQVLWTYTAKSVSFPHSPICFNFYVNICVVWEGLLMLIRCILLFQTLSRGSEEEPLGWWHAHIKVLRGEFCVVEYVGWESTYTDIVPLEQVRPVNRK